MWRKNQCCINCTVIFFPSINNLIYFFFCKTHCASNTTGWFNVNHQYPNHHLTLFQLKLFTLATYPNFSCSFQAHTIEGWKITSTLWDDEKMKPDKQEKDNEMGFTFLLFVIKWRKLFRLFFKHFTQSKQATCYKHVGEDKKTFSLWLKMIAFTDSIITSELLSQSTQLWRVTLGITKERF